MPRTPSPEASTDPTPSPSLSTSPVTEDQAATSLLFTHRPESPTTGSPESPSDLPSSPSSSPSDPLEHDADSASAPLSTAEEQPAPAVSPSKRRRQLLPATKAAVETVTGAAHQFLTVEGSPERDHGLWLATEEEIAAIADPLAGLASRRMGEGPENPDLTDLIKLAIGVAAYGMRQLHVRSRLRSLFHREQTPPDVAADMQQPEDQE
jgi:hypothetical protein